MRKIASSKKYSKKDSSESVEHTLALLKEARRKKDLIGRRTLNEELYKLERKLKQYVDTQLLPIRQQLHQH